MHYPATDLVIDPILIRKYDMAGPRSTSYPTADRLLLRLQQPGYTRPRPFRAIYQVSAAGTGAAGGRRSELSELHWGGGTPTFLARGEMSALMAALDGVFKRAPGFESAQIRGRCHARTTPCLGESVDSGSRLLAGAAAMTEKITRREFMLSSAAAGVVLPVQAQNVVTDAKIAA